MYAAHSIAEGHLTATGKTPYLPSADAQLLLENSGLSIFYFQISHKWFPLAEFKPNPHWPVNLVNVASKLSSPMLQDTV